jgi:hypothetical protein
MIQQHVKNALVICRVQKENIGFFNWPLLFSVRVGKMDDNGTRNREHFKLARQIYNLYTSNGKICTEVSSCCLCTSILIPTEGGI